MERSKNFWRPLTEVRVGRRQFPESGEKPATAEVQRSRQLEELSAAVKLIRIQLHWLGCLPRAARVALWAAFGRLPRAAIRAGGRRDKGTESAGERRGKEAKM